jgi:hypothetical protein
VGCRQEAGREASAVSVDWDRYQACSQVCDAGLGKPCLAMSGFVVGVGRIEVVAAAPHSPRKLTAAGGGRG